MLSGGCCCSRSCLVGACLGAKYGIEGIPADWLEKTPSVERALKFAVTIMKNYH